jgi:hypothetical protein
MILLKTLNSSQFCYFHFEHKQIFSIGFIKQVLHSYMEYKYPQSDFLNAFNNPLGQQYFKEAIPYLYTPLTKEAQF